MTAGELSFVAAPEPREAGVLWCLGETHGDASFHPYDKPKIEIRDASDFLRMMCNFRSRDKD